MSDDEARALIRGWCWTYWGRGPTADEQTYILATFHNQGVDLCLASITDHANAAKFRHDRGW